MQLILHNGIEMNKKSNTVVDVEAETNNSSADDSGVVSVGNVSARKWKISTMVVVFMAVATFVTMAVVGSVALADAKEARRAVEDYRKALQTTDKPQDRFLHGQVTAVETTTTTPWEKAPRLGQVARRDQSCRYKRAIGWGSSPYNAYYGCTSALAPPCACWISATYSVYSSTRRRHEVTCYVGTTGPIDILYAC
jgi:hypothetical protein